jgi:hypothetical protein
MVTPRVDAPDRSPNTTLAVTNAMAMNGVPAAMTAAGSQKPVMWLTTTVDAHQAITPTVTIGQRRRARSTIWPANGRELALKIAWIASR